MDVNVRDYIWCESCSKCARCVTWQSKRVENVTLECEKDRRYRIQVILTVGSG